MTMKNTSRTEEKCFGSRFGPATISACMILYNTQLSMNPNCHFCHYYSLSHLVIVCAANVECSLEIKLFAGVHSEIPRCN